MQPTTNASAATGAATAAADLLASGIGSTPFVLRALPYLDEKWLRANLHAALRTTEDLALLWNTLIRDQELYSGGGSDAAMQQHHDGRLNSAGNLAYMSPLGRHYCGAQRLQCTCCSGFCRPSSVCNCVACELLDSEALNEQQQQSGGPGGGGGGGGASKRHSKHHSAGGNDAGDSGAPGAPFAASDATLNAWLWGPVPTGDEQAACIRALLAEQHDISLRTASHSLSAVHLRQRLLVYQRYFTALQRQRQVAEGDKQSVAVAADDGQLSAARQRHRASDAAHQHQSLIAAATTPSTFGGAPCTPPPAAPLDATLGLARVGTRAALNFSFAFLRRAWRSGEDVDLCSELLSDALLALQALPEASLFSADGVPISALWLEVLERSTKFLRQVVLGSGCGSDSAAAVPRSDRHTALSLLLELGWQKGTLGAQLEVIGLLLQVWEKDGGGGGGAGRNDEDNRGPAVVDR